MNRLARVPWPTWVAIAVLALYAPALAYGFVYVDDKSLILDHVHRLAEPSSLWRAFGRGYFDFVDREHGYYRPIVTATYALDARWSGARAFGYHATNVVLHFGACCLSFALMHRLAIRRGVAFAATLLFAVHPALVTAVAWIPGRNDSLLAIFALGSLLFSLSALRARLLLSNACFLLALFTKETAVVLPLVSLVHGALVLRVWPRAWTWVGWVAAMGVYAWARTHAVRGIDTATAREALANLPMVIAGLGKIVLPAGLSVLATARDTPWWPGVIAVVLLGAGIARTDGTHKRVAAWGLATFALFALPGALTPGVLALENRLYVPALGVVVAGAAIADGVRVEARVAAAAAITLVLAFFALASGYRGACCDRRTFALAAVQGSPHLALAHATLGQVYQLEGMTEAAAREYTAALDLDPLEPIVHNNLAVLAMSRQRWPEAERELRAEIAVNPNWARAHANLGIVLRHEDRADEAEREFRIALEQDPDDEDARAALAR